MFRCTFTTGIYYVIFIKQSFFYLLYTLEITLGHRVNIPLIDDYNIIN